MTDDSQPSRVAPSNAARSRSRVHGASAIELVILMVLVLSLAMVAVGALGLTTRDTFARLSVLSGESSVEVVRPVDPPKLEEYYSLLHKLRIEKRREVWQWTGIAISAVLNVVLWIVLWRRTLQEARLKKAQQEDGNDKETESSIFDKRQRLLRMLAAHSSELIEGRMEVRHVMTTELFTVQAKSTLKEAAELMRQHHVRHLLVTCADSRLYGVVNSLDVCNGSAKYCWQVMRRDPVVVSPETPVIQALTTLLQGRASCLPVTQHGVLLGVITVTDAVLLAQAQLQFMTKLGEQLKPVIAERRGATISGHSAPQPSVST